MEVKKIVEGMTAVEVAEVIDSNFKNQNKILEEDIAKQNNVIGVSEYEDFSEAEAVAVGDVRKYEGFLYECVEATTGAFDASKWKKSSFKAETEKKLSELGSKQVVLFNDNISVVAKNVVNDIHVIQTIKNFKHIAKLYLEVGNIESSGITSESLFQVRINHLDGTFNSYNVQANSFKEVEHDIRKEISDIQIRVYTTQSSVSSEEYTYHNCKAVLSLFKSEAVNIDYVFDSLPNLWDDPSFSLLGTSSGDMMVNRIGNCTFSVVDSIFGKSCLISVPIGSRAQIIPTNSIKTEIGNVYSFGFFYKQTKGTIKPVFARTTLSQLGFSEGFLERKELTDGWSFIQVHNVSAINPLDNLPLIIDYDNRAGSDDCEAYIAHPVVIAGEKIERIPVWNGINALSTLANQTYNELFNDSVSRIGVGNSFSYSVIWSSKDYKNKYITVYVGEDVITDNSETFVQIRSVNSSGTTLQKVDAYAGDVSSMIIPSNAYRTEVRLYTSVSSEDTVGFEYSISNIKIKIGEIPYLDGRVARLESLSKKRTWSGRTLVTYGDSITAINNGTFFAPFEIANSTTWGNRVSALCDFISHRGRGVGGQTYVWNDNTWYADNDGNYLGRPDKGDSKPEGAKEPKGAFCSWDRIATSIPKDIADGIDCIIIMGGTNDFANVKEFVTPIWESSNTTDNNWISSSYYNGGDFDISDFCGAIASTIMKMQLRCPNATIILSTPLPYWKTNKPAPQVNQYGLTMYDVARIEEKVAHFMGIPVIDLNGECNINGINYTDYITDGIHPYSDNGKIAIGNYISGKLNTINPKKPHK